MSLTDKINSWFGDYEEPVADESYQDSRVSEEEPRIQRSSRVMSLRSSKGEEVINKKIMLFEPSIFSDVKAIASRLLSGEAAVINFQKMDDQQAHRVVDFLSGVIFAIDGEISRVGDKIFLCTPREFTVEGDIHDNNVRQTDF
ncbi:cell division protein SepF [Ligilactobacillus pabuli]|uniref:Cell division protein SepF n=1 Tax=Ligilactobacillus pabuli TaxID=2886039 RepID=A0ABQ5JKG7_9LACO|nr:cell division protein SepF [Ligilactobacillus pabuli]GKS81937.1 cell division protein SepF [Ligilactobacillus pabuli]HIW88926.1 cell division protein SepF [Candidatus Ligilactobacillus excrementipullorum]